MTMKKALVLLAVCGLVGASTPAYAGKGGVWISGNCNMTATGNKWYVYIIPLNLGC
jgi:hypothetical protein